MSNGKAQCSDLAVFHSFSAAFKQPFKSWFLLPCSCPTSCCKGWFLVAKGIKKSTGPRHWSCWEGQFDAAAVSFFCAAKMSEKSVQIFSLQNRGSVSHWRCWDDAVNEGVSLWSVTTGKGSDVQLRRTLKEAMMLATSTGWKLMVAMATMRPPDCRAQATTMLALGFLKQIKREMSTKLYKTLSILQVLLSVDVAVAVCCGCLPLLKNCRVYALYKVMEHIHCIHGGFQMAAIGSSSMCSQYHRGFESTDTDIPRFAAGCRQRQGSLQEGHTHNEHSVDQIKVERCTLMHSTRWNRWALMSFAWFAAISLCTTESFTFAWSHGHVWEKLTPSRQTYWSWRELRQSSDGVGTPSSIAPSQAASDNFSHKRWDWKTSVSWRWMRCGDCWKKGGVACWRCVAGIRPKQGLPLSIATKHSIFTVFVQLLLSRRLKVWSGSTPSCRSPWQSGQFVVSATWFFCAWRWRPVRLKMRWTSCSCRPFRHCLHWGGFACLMLVSIPATTPAGKTRSIHH